VFEHIMVSLDGTPLAEQALSPAVSLARASGAHLHLATVLAPAHAGLSELSLELSADREEDYLEQVAARVRDAGVSTVSTAQLKGESVVDALEAHRAEVKAGLTVMCTHGRGAVQRAWLGSVADRLVRASEAPLLLVRAAPIDEATGSEIRTDVSFKRVLVALDGSHLSRQSLGPATKLAGKEDAVYVLARVMESPVGVGAGLIPGSEGTDARLQKARALAEAKLSLEVQSFAPDGYNVESVAEFASSAAEGILELAKSRDADVIVIATHGRKGVSRMMLGSVADKVVRGADRPVLVVRPNVPSA